MVIDDDESDSTDDEDEDEDEAEVIRGSVDPSSAEQDANPYSALQTQDKDPELRKPIIPSSPERRYDVDAGCYIDDEPLIGLEPRGQKGSAASILVRDHSHSLHHSPRPPHHQIGQHDNNKITQSISEEPAPRSLPKPLDVDDGGDGGENVSELERDMLMAFEEQEKSSSTTALSSPQPPCRYIEQLSSRINQEDNQGNTSHGRLDELGYSSLLREQEYSKEKLQEQHPQHPQHPQQPQQPQQEVAVQAMREEEDDDIDNWEQWRETRRRQDEIGQTRTNVYHSNNSSHTYNASNEDKDLRPAKRQKFRLRPRVSLMHNEDSDSSESPRPAKRRQSSPSDGDPTPKGTCKHHLQPPHKRQTTPVQTQPEQSLIHIV